MSDTPIPPTDPAPTDPAPTSASAPRLSLGRRAVVFAQAEFASGVQADPPAFHSGPRIAVYFAACVRGGKLLGLKEGNWCSAFASWCLWNAALQAANADREATGLQETLDLTQEALAWAPGENVEMPPVGYRAGVSELCSDAKKSGVWHDIGELGRASPSVGSPSVGDLLIFGRDGADPRVGGTGHVVIVEAVGCLDANGNVREGCDAGNSWVVISGNGPGGRIAREVRGPHNRVEPMVGWIVLS